MVWTLQGNLKDYAWGLPNGLSRWISDPDPTHVGPQAELWYGAHPNGPSTVLSGGEFTEAPLLVKILAAGHPLSIQLHPVAGFARDGWARQEAGTGPALFADPHEKTEMLVALEPFAVLAGWRVPAVAARILRRAGAPELAAAADEIDSGDPRAAIRILLGLTRERAGAVIPALHDAVADQAPHTRRAFQILAADYPDDPGVLVAVLLDDDVLEPGDAVFMPAGTPHAYLRGIGVEVMTSSDNVLRLGLTVKTVAVEESLAALVDGRESVVVRAPQPHAGARTYDLPGSPFIVTSLADGASITAPTGSYRLVLALRGRAEVSVDDRVIQLVPGTAVALGADEPAARLDVSGAATLATGRSVGT